MERSKFDPAELNLISGLLGGQQIGLIFQRAVDRGKAVRILQEFTSEHQGHFNWRRYSVNYPKSGGTIHTFVIRSDTDVESIRGSRFDRAYFLFSGEPIPTRLEAELEQRSQLFEIKNL